MSSGIINIKHLRQGNLIGYQSGDISDPEPYYVTEVRRGLVYAYRYDNIGSEKKITAQQMVGFRVLEPILEVSGFYYRDGYFMKAVPGVKNLRVSVKFATNNDLLVGLKYEKELLFLRRVQYMHQFQNLMLDMFDIDILKDVSNEKTHRYIG